MILFPSFSINLFLCQDKESTESNFLNQVGISNQLGNDLIGLVYNLLHSLLQGNILSYWNKILSLWLFRCINLPLSVSKASPG